jgi:homopolymeric O-antigen transport system permease protein
VRKVTINGQTGQGIESPQTGAAAEHWQTSAVMLPDLPVAKIRPSRFWVPLNLRDLWAFRELLYFLTWRDIKVRYRQTLLGASWAIMQPLGTMLVFTLVFATLVHQPDKTVPYAVFALAGLIPWTFFANTVVSAANSLIFSADLLTKVYFPRMIIPASALGLGLVDLTLASGVLVALILWYDVEMTWRALYVLPLLLLTVLLTLGVGLGLSALNVKYRDIRHATPFLIQLGIFVTPVIYPLEIVPDSVRWLLMLNPMTGIVEGFRAALFGDPFDTIALTMSIVITLVILVSSAYLFRHMEKSFADLV